MKIKKLKHATPILIISICIVVLEVILMMLFALAIIGIDEMLKNREISSADAASGKAYAMVYIVVAFISVVIQLVAGIKSKNSKKWNSFLVGWSAITIFYSFISISNDVGDIANIIVSIIGMVLNLVVIILAGLNLKDFEKQKKELEKVERGEQIINSDSDIV